ncbi:unnamed protein product [Gongylonema pulchrum]|uniref:RNASEK-C17orf49 readthrough (Non-protein coding) n=1 Tax=Gongylonema pulchrum TaxID=637853 RepID=A0A183EUX9_9BILA|nr:unnamed protein product [Gongylonema pulchrum]
MLVSRDATGIDLQMDIETCSYRLNMNAASENSTDGRSAQFRGSVAQGIEHLKEVGTQIQQALSNFGDLSILWILTKIIRIDVDVGVQHGGITEKIPKLESPGNEITEPKREEVNLTEEKSCISPEASDAKSEDGKQKNDLDSNVVTLQEFNGLEKSLENLHITKKCSENQPDTDEATKEADMKSPACDSAAAVEDNISEDWTMLENINNSGNKTNLGNGKQSLAVKDLF